MITMLRSLIVVAVTVLCGSAYAQGTTDSVCTDCTGNAVTTTGHNIGTLGTMTMANSTALRFPLPFTLAYSIQATALTTTNQIFLDTRPAGTTVNGFLDMNCSTCGDSTFFSLRFAAGATTSKTCAFDTCAQPTAITGGAWHDVIKVTTATGTRFYIDGKQVDFNSFHATYVPSTTDWQLGNSGTNQSVAFRDMAVWNRALTAREIARYTERHAGGFDVFSGNVGTLLKGMVDGWTMASCTTTCSPAVGSDSWVTVAGPQIVISNPTGTPTWSGTHTINGTCSGCTATSYVYVDNVRVATFTGATFSTSFNTTLVNDSDNPHTVSVVGNGLTALTATVTADFNTGNGAPPAPQTYYLSATGNDSNSGTSPGSPWLSPNHRLRCGDTILAASSTAYSYHNFDGSSTGTWGSVFACPTNYNPSTGISPTSVDPGSGVQFAFLKCNGNIGSCYINNTAGFQSISVNADHWAVQGWQVSNSAGHCMNANTAVPGRPNFPGTGTIGGIPAIGSQLPIFILFLNDYAFNCKNAAIDATDYSAVVGSMWYGSAFGASPCYSGSTYNAMFDHNPTDTGTHVFQGGNFVHNNYNAKGCTDGEGLILDDWNFGATTTNPAPFSGYGAQAVIEQSLFSGGSSYGYERNPSQGTVTTPASVYFTNNTSWGDGLGYGPAMLDYPNSHGQGGGNIGMLQSSSNFPVHNFFMNSIVIGTAQNFCLSRVSPFTCPPVALRAFATFHSSGCVDCPITNSYVWNTAVPTPDPSNCGLSGQPVCHNIENTGFGRGAGLVQADPDFASPAFLTTPPVCTGFATVRACMAAYAANFKPNAHGSAPGAAAFGFQDPPLTCTDSNRPTDGLYPIWIKNAVPDGFLTKPCGY